MLCFTVFSLVSRFFPVVVVIIVLWQIAEAQYSPVIQIFKIAIFFYSLIRILYTT